MIPITETQATPLPNCFDISREVAQALHYKKPIVALESAVITHGLPYPKNIQLALDMEAEIISHQAIPATIALLDGKIKVGLSREELERLGTEKKVNKISRRDFAPAIAHKQSGGTTVSATMYAAKTVGIHVFATGGIGGVHRNATNDISPDLPELSQTAVIVVCAGAKAILDIPATIEYLETYGVPVLGYQCDEFPAFYAAKSGIPVHCRVESPWEIIEITKIHWNLGFKSGILVVNPPPEQFAMDYETIDVAVLAALKNSELAKIKGQAVTPFLLQKMSELTHGESLTSNIALLLNNAKLAAQIATQLHSSPAYRI